MKLKLDETTGTDEIKSRFSNLFPYLKIEFFRSAHRSEEGSLPEDIIHEDLTVSELKGKSGTINLTGDVKVSELEKEFRDNIGLNVQVFRKSGDVWLETTTTDGWSLLEQNNHALERQKNKLI